MCLNLKLLAECCGPSAILWHKSDSVNCHMTALATECAAISSSNPDNRGSKFYVCLEEVSGDSIKECDLSKTLLCTLYWMKRGYGFSKVVS